MKNLIINENEYKIIKTLKSDDKIYYYTLDIKNDNEVVILFKNIKDSDETITHVDEREYSILMNKFALK